MQTVQIHFTPGAIRTADQEPAWQAAHRVLDACQAEARDLVSISDGHGSVRVDPWEHGFQGNMTYDPAQTRPVHRFGFFGTVESHQAVKDFWPRDMQVTKWEQQHYQIHCEGDTRTTRRDYLGVAETVEVDTKTGAIRYTAGPSDLCHW